MSSLLKIDYVINKFVVFISGFILLTLISLPAHANYDKTKWEMPLKKVMELYPGGHLSKEQNGLSNYSVIREINGYSNALLFFYFNESNLLKDVTILFPKPGTIIDLKEGLYIEPSKKEAKAIFDSLREALIFKYGKVDSSSKQNTLLWLLKENDVISLVLNEGITSIDKSNVGLHYERLKNEKELKTGI